MFAAATNQLVVEQLAFYTRSLAVGQEIWIFNLPDRFEDAYVFRNTFPAVGMFIGYPQLIHAVLDVEWKQLSAADQGQTERRTESCCYFRMAI